MTTASAAARSSKRAPRRVRTLAAPQTHPAPPRTCARRTASSCGMRLRKPSSPERCRRAGDQKSACQVGGDQPRVVGNTERWIGAKAPRLGIDAHFNHPMTPSTRAATRSCRAAFPFPVCRAAIKGGLHIWDRAVEVDAALVAVTVEPVFDLQPRPGIHGELRNDVLRRRLGLREREPCAPERGQPALPSTRSTAVATGPRSGRVCLLPSSPSVRRIARAHTPAPKALSGHARPRLARAQNRGSRSAERRDWHR